jgi:hypothetical protein
VRREQVIARNIPSRRKFLCFKLPMVITSTSSSRAAKSDNHQAGVKTARDTHSAVTLLKTNPSPTTHTYTHTHRAVHSTRRASRSPKPKPRQYARHYVIIILHYTQRSRSTVSLSLSLIYSNRVKTDGETNTLRRNIITKNPSVSTTNLLLCAQRRSPQRTFFVLLSNYTHTHNYLYAGHRGL